MEIPPALPGGADVDISGRRRCAVRCNGVRSSVSFTCRVPVRQAHRPCVVDTRPRSDCIAAEVRLLTVPSAHFIATAVSRTEKSAKYRRTIAARWRVGMRRDSCAHGDRFGACQAATRDPDRAASRAWTRRAVAARRQWERARLIATRCAQALGSSARRTFDQSRHTRAKAPARTLQQDLDARCRGSWHPPTVATRVDRTT